MNGDRGEFIEIVHGALVIAQDDRIKGKKIQSQFKWT